LSWGLHPGGGIWETSVLTQEEEEEDEDIYLAQKQQ